MEIYQIQKIKIKTTILLYNKGNPEQNGKVTYWITENICKSVYDKEFNIQNI